MQLISIIIGAKLAQNSYQEPIQLKSDFTQKKHQTSPFLNSISSYRINI